MGNSVHYIRVYYDATFIDIMTTQTRVRDLIPLLPPHLQQKPHKSWTIHDDDGTFHIINPDLLLADLPRQSINLNISQVA